MFWAMNVFAAWAESLRQVSRLDRVVSQAPWGDRSYSPTA